MEYLPEVVIEQIFEYLDRRELEILIFHPTFQQIITQCRSLMKKLPVIFHYRGSIYDPINDILMESDKVHALVISGPVTDKEKLQKVCGKVKVLSFNNYFYQQNYLKIILNSLPNLEELDLTAVQFQRETEVVLEPIYLAPQNLECLKLTNYQLDLLNGGIQVKKLSIQRATFAVQRNFDSFSINSFIREQKNLKVLELYDLDLVFKCDFADKVVFQLGELQLINKAKHIMYEEIIQQKSNLMKFLRNQKNLKKLVLRSVGFFDLWSIILEELKELEYLELSPHIFQDAIHYGDKFIKNLSVTKLILTDYFKAGPFEVIVNSFPNIRELHCNFRLNDHHLDAASSLININYLSVQNFDENVYFYFPGTFTNLKTLIVEFTIFCNNSMEIWEDFVEKFKNLENFFLRLGPPVKSKFSPIAAVNLFLNNLHKLNFLELRECSSRFYIFQVLEAIMLNPNNIKTLKIEKSAGIDDFYLNDLFEDTGVRVYAVEPNYEANKSNFLYF